MNIITETKKQFDIAFGTNNTTLPDTKTFEVGKIYDFGNYKNICLSIDNMTSGWSRAELEITVFLKQNLSATFEPNVAISNFSKCAETPYLSMLSTNTVITPIKAQSSAMTVKQKSDKEMLYLQIALDAEWYVNEKQERVVLSQQYCVEFENNLYSFIIIFKNKKRITLQYALKYIVSYIKYHQKHITIVCHFSSVDLSTFDDFYEWKNRLNNVRKCLVSLLPTKMSYTDKNKHTKEITLHIRDTMLLSPSGKALSDIGDALGLPKIELLDGYSKDRMDIFLQEQPFEFYKYALNDSYITLRWAQEMSGKNTKMEITLGGEATKIAKQKIMEYLNLKDNKEFNDVWLGMLEHKTINENNKRITEYTENNNASIVRHIAMKCYHGGHNECYTVGLYFNENGLNDIDLSGAYTTAMALCPDIDYSKIPTIIQGTLGLNTIKMDSIGYGLVEFEFPEDTMYPCLPVKDDFGRGLIYPLKGLSNATAPEIYIALTMGAKVNSTHFVMPQILYNSHSLLSTVQHFTKLRNNAKIEFGKGSAQELKYKEMGNSVYGKLGQGLKGKMTYNIYSDKSEEVGVSKITNPLLASHTTGLVRALLGAVMTELYVMGEEIHSITTDGFITTANTIKMAQLKGAGLVEMFLKGRKLATLDDSITSIWEMKNTQKQLLNIKTRGNIGLDSDGGGVLAKAGYKFNTKLSRDQQQKALADMYLKRDGRVFMEYEQLPNAKDYIRNRADAVAKKVVKGINMDYDFKRQPIDIEDYTTNINGENITHLRFRTKPHNTIEDFDRYRKAQENTLDTIKTAEVVNLVEFKTKTSHTKVRVNDKKLTIFRSILKLIRQGKLKNKITINGKKTEIWKMIDTVLDMKLSNTQWKTAWDNSSKKARQNIVIDYELIKDYTDKMFLIYTE